MKPETILVVFGKDSDAKPRAAKFDVEAADEAIVFRAAAAQGLNVGRPQTDEAMEVALRLVDGRIYKSGKGLLPLVNAATYDQLVKLLEIEKLKPELDQPPKPAATVSKPRSTKDKATALATVGGDPWEKLIVGSSVLCRDTSNKDGGWWLCRVFKVSSDSRLLTVSWAGVGFGKMPPFTVRRSQVAILPVKV